MGWTQQDAAKVWPWLLPLARPHITQYFKGGFNGSGENGIDLGMPAGTPVTALYAGTVLTSGYYGGGGVVTTESSVPGLGVASVYYQHLDLNAPAMVPGRKVKVGDVIGWSGGQLSGGHHPSEPRFSSGPHIEIGFNAPFGKNGLWHPLGPNVNPLPYLQKLVANGPSTTDIVTSSAPPPAQTVQTSFTNFTRGTGPVGDSFVAVETRLNDDMTIAYPSIGGDWTKIMPWNWGQTTQDVQQVVVQDIEALLLRGICILLGISIFLAFIFALAKPVAETALPVAGAAAALAA